MADLHRAIKRHLKRLKLEEQQPPSAEQWTDFLSRMNQSFQTYDEESYLLERALDVSSKEMQQVYEALRQASASELYKEKAKLMLILKAMNEGVCELDLNGYIQFANPRALALMGVAQADLTHRKASELFKASECNEAEMFDYLAQGKIFNDSDASLRTPNGELDIDLTLSPLMDDQQLVGAVLVFRDVSLQRETEAQMKRAVQLAEEANRAKSDFLATMSHEIRTPLNGVIGMSNLLLDTSLSAEQQEFTHTIISSGEALLSIINDILDFSKIEAGQMEIVQEPLVVPQLLDVVVDLFGLQFTEKGLELIVFKATDVPDVVMGDIVRLRQVLINFVGNALKFTKQGEVTVTVSCVHADTLRIEVTDTGIGINDAGKAKLFKAFSQADSSTTREYGGTGLGLTISAKLVDLMGGQVGVESTEGQGSTFWFEIPCQPVLDETLFPVSTELDSQILQGRKVLIVDDNETNCRLLTLQLREWGMVSDFVYDSSQALIKINHKLQSDEPFYDLIILDMLMPGMDGLELGHILRQMPLLKDCKLLLASSSYEKLNHHPFDAVLSKPLKATILKKQILQLLSDVKKPETATLPAQSSADVVSQSTPSEQKDDLCVSDKHCILVVEDNRVNQLLATKILGKLGYDFVLAENGQEAVNAVQMQDFDVVLMDCQMPVLDGYQATGEIRKLEVQKKSRLPIIGLTANAMEGDREKCITSGMDDYLTKPINIPMLKEKLEQYIK